MQTRSTTGASDPLAGDADDAPRATAGDPVSGTATSHTEARVRFVHLDMARGLAAVAVVLGHTRGFFFVDYGQSSGGVVAKAFYFLTGIHHQAVMIFFVLSGFLVGGSVVRAFGRGGWNWRRYLLQRLPRLWIVIVPALVLTLLWDSLGMHMPGAAGYAGRWFGQLSSGPSPGPGDVYDLGATAFAGNALFLQTIAVASYGSNGPLWSLANEFWYYLLFPLALQVILGRSIVGRIVGIVLLAAIAWMLPGQILWYGLIWLFGVGSFLAFTTSSLRGLATSWPVGLAALAIVGVSLLASRAQYWLGSDYILGAAFALLVPWLAARDCRNALYRRVSFAASEISYTLYLVHFPLLTFLYFTWLAPAQLSLSVASLGTMTLIIVAVLVYAGAMWWLFERNTARLRGGIAALLDRAWPAGGAR